ncbi:MAG: META domain-containing protein [Bacteroidales bacterium]
MKNQLTYFAIASLLLILVSSCGSTCKMANKKTLTSQTWELNTVKGSAIDAKEFVTGTPYLLFQEKGKLLGSTGCNNMVGSFKLKKACLQLNPGAITKMFCQGSGEAIFLDAIKQVQSMKISADKLTLLNGNKEVMTFVPKK